MWRPISTAPRDGTWVVIGKPGWTLFPKAKWTPVDCDDGVFWVWLFADDMHNIGVGEGSVGWEEDHTDGNMPTVWAPLPDEVDE